MAPEEIGLFPQALMLTGLTLIFGGFVWRQRLKDNRSAKLTLCARYGRPGDGWGVAFCDT